MTTHRRHTLGSDALRFTWLVRSSISIPLSLLSLFVIGAGCAGASDNDADGVGEVEPLEESADDIANGTVPVHIIGERASIDPASGDLLQDGTRFRFVYKPDPLQTWVRKPWISPTQSYAGHRAIGLEIFPSGTPVPANAGGATNDKAHLELSKVPFNRTSYFGFGMLLSGDNFDVPKAGILLAQMWQGSPYSPPLSLQLIPNDPKFTCEVRISNNATGGNPSARSIHLPVGTCTPGAWHAFRFSVTPHYPGQPGTGKVIVWHNDMNKPVATYTGDVGYDPGRPVDVNGTPGKLQSPAKPNSAFTLHYGPYRGRQDARAQTFWGNMKFGFSAAAADPTRP